MTDLQGRIAVVAGGSRGAGKGIALALGDAGATVYVAGRTSGGGPPPADGAPGTIEDTAAEVTRRGGRGIPAQVDCTDDQQVAALFARVEKEHGTLDVLANAVEGRPMAMFRRKNGRRRGASRFRSNRQSCGST